MASSPPNGVKEPPSFPHGASAVGPAGLTVRSRRATVADAGIIHELYAATPSYFDIISIPVPTEQEVATDLATAASDARRFVEIALLEGDAGLALGRECGCRNDTVTGLPVVAYVDYKLDYPEDGDATVNLLLVRSELQSSGVGSAVALSLEERLKPVSRRLLASIYGDNPRARRFWQRLGYRFAIDAKPLLDWYAKELT